MLVLSFPLHNSGSVPRRINGEVILRRGVLFFFLCTVSLHFLYLHLCACHSFPHCFPYIPFTSCVTKMATASLFFVFLLDGRTHYLNNELATQRKERMRNENGGRYGRVNHRYRRCCAGEAWSNALQGVAPSRSLVGGNGTCYDEELLSFFFSFCVGLYARR